MKPVSRPTLTDTARRLTHPQLAFVRAWAEGVDLQSAAQRYLRPDSNIDARHARAELQALLDLLRSLARAHGRADLAALLRRDPASMVEPTARAPSLDEFRAQQPEDFYSEAELLELYTATHGAPDARSGTRRRQRLRARQLAALQWLEGVAVREPQPADPIAGWLDERLAARLSAVGLTRLEQLRAWIRRHGFHWHRSIPKVGAVAAARVLAWWQQHARTLGALPAWVTVAPRQLDGPRLARGSSLPALPVRDQRLAGPPLPLERLAPLAVPAALSGRSGLHRAGPARPAQPDDDLAALQAWLGRRTPGSATWRAYRKEAERLLLWAWWVAGKPVSSLQPEDLAAYEAFLLTPPEGWTAPRGTPRWHEDWRPFETGLSAGSARMALGIVRGMLDAWVAQGYLAVNPWTVNSRTVRSRTVAPGSPGESCADQDSGAGHRPGLVTVSQQPTPAQAVDRSAGRLRALSADHARAMLAWMEHQIHLTGHTPARLRLQALWTLAWTTGMRPAELVAARTGWLRTAGPSVGLAADAAAMSGAAAVGATVELHIPPGAAAGAARGMVLDRLALTALRRYLDHRGLWPGAAHGSNPAPVADAPLFAHLASGRPLSPARLYELMADAFSACADGLADQDPAAAAAIRQASTHWLRHGFGLEVARAGTPAPELQHRMGHRSRTSSAVYRRAVQREEALRAEGASARE